jgi:hypothetical protein
MTQTEGLIELKSSQVRAALSALLCYKIELDLIIFTIEVRFLNFEIMCSIFGLSLLPIVCSVSAQTFEAKDGVLVGALYINTEVPSYTGTGYVTGFTSTNDTSLSQFQRQHLVVTTLRSCIMFNMEANTQLCLSMVAQQFKSYSQTSRP